MKISYTSKLYFGKYPYKVALHTRLSGGKSWKIGILEPLEFQVLTVWCEQHMGGEHKIRRRFRGYTNPGSDWHQLVYVQTEAAKNALVQAYGAQVEQVWQPLDNSHLQSLEVRNITEVRSNLLFKKYKHVIYFKYDRSHHMWNWLKSLLQGSSTSDLKGDKWWPRVYSTDMDDINMIQLSFPENIDYIKHVILVPTESPPK